MSRRPAFEVHISVQLDVAELEKLPSESVKALLAGIAGILAAEKQRAEPR